MLLAGFSIQKQKINLGVIKVGNSTALLEIKNIKKYFKNNGIFNKYKYIKAIEDVSLSINKGETFGLVGESGCGKTTVGRCILKVYPLTSGEIWYNGENITNLDEKRMLPYRKQLQMIFQDPYTSLDPRMTVGEIIGAPIDVHKLYSGSDKRDKIKELINLVGLKSNHLNHYPHEFSGGQRQRIGIARALSVEPSLIVCDEPLSALDVSIQAQILNSLINLKEKLGLTFLFISHNLSVVRYISNKVAVMYLGNIMEYADVEELYSNILHPYSQALFSAIQEPKPRKSKKSNRILLQGDLPSPLDVPTGCIFRTRCPYVLPICSEVKPSLKKVASNHFVACHLICPS